MIKTKRAYETPTKSDGFRVLVERLWPRGIKKADLHLNEWMKDLAPSTHLRKSFGHDPNKWNEFKSQYREELNAPAAKAKIKQLIELAQTTNVTLIYSARDQEHNSALVLKDVLEKQIKRTKSSL